LRRLTAEGRDCVAVVPEGEPADRLQDLSPRPAILRFSGPQSMGDSVAALSPRVVFHLGAVISNRPKLEDLTTTLEWNLLSTVGLYRCLTKSGVERVVQLGSCEEYGRRPGPFRESDAPDPVSPYSASKAAITCYARMFYNCFSLPVVVLRPSLVYGPGQTGNMLVPQVVSALLAGLPVDTTEGRQTRDFLYVDDLVEAMLRAATVPGIEGEVLNVGSGQAVTVRQCIEQIEELTGRRGLVNYGARPYGRSEIWEYAPDISRARQVLGWQPATSLHSGLRRTISAFQGSGEAPHAGCTR
jgi:nucleoside-diphosphate-sugar epimerase